MLLSHGKIQTLLYNLFDVTQSQQAPMCVLGITNRIDVMDLLEKRVKSRFSHRHIFIFPNEQDPPGTPLTPRDRYLGVLVQLLSVPVKKEVKKRGRKSTVSISEMETDQDIPAIPNAVLRSCDIDPKEFSALEPSLLEQWNTHVSALAAEETVIDAIEKFCYYMSNQQVFRNVLFQLVSKLSPARPLLTGASLASLVHRAVSSEQREWQLRALSPLELTLAVAAMHSAQILDNQPVNFEMVLHRYNKFALSNSMQGAVPRALALKAFEHLQQLEILVPAATAHGTVHKEHRLHCLSVSPEAVRAAVRGARHLPTEIQHWLDNHIG
ncbi:hypothetical protein O0L34_g13248 [Tuta absoluta]|nr:hypothetical protein O0L34_g13248 [Tuta absoluta]